MATEYERNLESFRGSHHLPAVAIRYEHELWLEYVEGSLITEIDTASVEKVADFYATIYTQRARVVNLAKTAILFRLQRDLSILHQVGILSDAAYRDLSSGAEKLAPVSVWIGFDYVDAVLKNFIVTDTDGIVCGIDVESLRRDQLIGTGVANALTRWLGPFQQVFFQRLFQRDAPDFRSYFPFVELCYVAAWTKMYCFEKKRKRIRPDIFERFRSL